MSEGLFLIAAFLSEVIGTMAGFGSSTIFLPIALFFVNFKTALVLVGFLHIFGNVGRITFFRHGIDKKLLVLFGIPSVLLTIIGALLVHYIAQDVLKSALGFFLIAFSTLSLAKPNFLFRASALHAIIGGVLSGFFAGLIGTGGALRGAFLTSFALEKHRYIATAAMIALAVDITRIPIYFASGFLEARYVVYIPLLFGAAIAGSYAGKSIINKIPQKIFRITVLVALILIGLKFIVEGFVR